MLTKTQLEHCLKDSLAALNETKNIHLLISKITEAENYTNFNMPVYEVTIMSSNDECTDFEIIANRNGCGELYKKDYTKLCRELIKEIWKNFKIHKFEKEDKELRNSVFKKLMKDWEGTAEAHKSSQVYAEIDTNVTKEIIDKLDEMNSGPKWKDIYLHNDIYTMSEVNKLLEKGTVEVNLKDWEEP